MGSPGVSEEKPRAAAGANLVLGLLVVSVILNYIDRSNLSIAAPQLKDELGISAQQLGWLLSAFFWTYAACQIPAGWMVDRFDVKYVFASGFALWSLATAVTGRLHSLAMLFAIRIILGVGESVAFPSYSKILSRLFPEEQRGFANALIAMGLGLGPGIGLLFGGELMARFGWRPFFFVLGLVSMVWLFPWMRSMPPEDRVEVHVAAREHGVDILLRSRDLWGVSLCHFCANYSLYFMLTWLPFYLVKERAFSMEQMAKVGAAYFFTAAASASAFGRLSDRWIRKGNTPTRVRKGILIYAYLAMGVLLVANVLAPRALSVVLLIGAGTSAGAGSCNIWAVTQTLAGHSSVGRWVGVKNLWGSVAGAVTAAATGYTVQKTGHFTVAFFLVALVLWTGSASWAWIVGPIEPVDWDAVAKRRRVVMARGPA
jgi:ACS family D-galactonate transporter-like MFS transporter